MMTRKTASVLSYHSPVVVLQWGRADDDAVSVAKLIDVKSAIPEQDR
jgi:hypothetical protein